MGKLKPIGSEKLQGMDKINRMIEIARYNEHKPNPINENKSLEYSKSFSDGQKYHIVKETNGYVIKKGNGLNESNLDYIEPLKGRKYYSSYSQALKRLNIMAKDVNSSEGYLKNLSLFESESEVDDRYFLKSDNGETNEQEDPAAAATPPAPAPDMAPAPAPDMAPTPDMDPELDDMGDEDMGDEDMGDEDEEKVTFKDIQKLTGKLGQKIRTFMDDEENEMSSKDIKYVINSILSALDLDALEDEDLESIIAKLEGEEEGEEEGAEGEESPEEVSTPETGVAPEAGPAPPVAPEGGEVAEFDFSDEDEDDDFYPRHGARKRHMYDELSEEESDAVKGMIDGIFSESKVDNILKKYFRIDEKEKSLLEEKRKQKTLINENTNKNISRIKNLSESIAQEISATKLIKKYPKVKFIGKSQQNNLVFESNNKRIKVTPKGSIL